MPYRNSREEHLLGFRLIYLHLSLSDKSNVHKLSLLLLVSISISVAVRSSAQVITSCPTCNGMGGMGYYGSAGGVYTASAPPGSMTTPNFAMPASNPYTPKSTVKGTGELVSSLIDKLPNGDTKNGLKEYVALLGYDQYYGDSSVGGANAGISSYFSNRFNDP